mmetsp:Transcript_30648/g.63972  ORF Transcript_30648/g.63972 Transcript_30648/m.63972 type:complete len:215 (+) Transcript_30648:749-1393(+)
MLSDLRMLLTTTIRGIQFLCQKSTSADAADVLHLIAHCLGITQILHVPSEVRMRFKFSTILGSACLLAVKRATHFVICAKTSSRKFCSVAKICDSKLTCALTAMRQLCSDLQKFMTNCNVSRRQSVLAKALLHAQTLMVLVLEEKCISTHWTDEFLVLYTNIPSSVFMATMAKKCSSYVTRIRRSQSRSLSIVFAKKIKNGVLLKKPSIESGKT